MYKSMFMVLTIGLLAVVMVAVPSVTTGSYASTSGWNWVDTVNTGVEHINQAQAALQNGDIEGANKHLELAKQSLQSREPDMGQRPFD